MGKSPFRHPSEMPKEDERIPVSARIRINTRKALEQAAEASGLSLGSLIANVLDDYAEFLEELGRGKKGKIGRP